MTPLLLLMAQLAGAVPVSPAHSGRYLVTTQGESPQKAMLVLQVRNGSVRAAVGPSEQELRPVVASALDDGVVTLTIGASAMEWRLTADGPGLSGQARRGSIVENLALERTGDLMQADRLRLLSLLPYEAPRDRSQAITELREALEFGDPDVVGAFWKRVDEQGTPLYESVDGDETSVLATFVWRGNDRTRSVLLNRGRFTFQQPIDGSLFSHVEGTDVWFKTVRLPRGARFTYRLSENHPAAVLPRGAWPAVEVSDPLNPRRANDRSVVRATDQRSLAELPGAPAQPWLASREGVPTLTATKHRISSQILGNERDVLVYTPPGYDPSRTAYSTVYLLDAEDPGGPVFQPTTIENLINESAIPPIVVVRIANPSGAARSRELSCNPSFARFLGDELVPFVRRHYHVSASPADTLVGGQSLGGLAAACAGLERPDLFGLLLAQSGSFWWEPTGRSDAEPNWVAREILRRPVLPLRFHLEAGRFEVDLLGRGGNILETTRHLRDVLRAKSYDVHYQEFVGEHEWVNWRGSLVGSPGTELEFAL